MFKKKEKSPEITPPQEATIEQPSKLKLWAKRYWVTLATIAVILILTIIVYCTGGLSSDISAYGYFGIFLISLLAATAIFIPIPSVPAVILMGAILNPFLVGLMSGLGETIGEISAYTAGVSGRAALDKKERYTRIKKWMKRRGTLVLFLFAATPNFFFKLVGAAAGAMRYPFWKFLLVTLIGKTVKGAIFAFIGYGILRLILHWIIG
jgi:uncharacterized membrane protein YdjX (TVP38/TMEM64 family)